jgi:hypothetical protein
VFAWGTLTLDDSATENVGFYPQLRLTHQDDPVVAYGAQSALSQAVRLLRYRNGGSVVSVLDQGGTLGAGYCPESYFSKCIAMDLNAVDETVVVYRDPGRRGLTVVR